MGGGGDGLGRGVIEGSVAAVFHTERHQRRDIGEARGPACRGGDAVQIVFGVGRPDGFQRQAVADFRKGTFTFEARVENFERALWGPSPWGSRTPQRVAAAAGDAPDFAGKRFRLQRLQRVQKRPVVAAGHLRVGSVGQAFDHLQHAIGLPYMNKVYGSGAVQEGVFGVEPDAGFLRGVELGEAVDDVAEVGDFELGLGVGGRFARGPAGHRGLGYGRNVGEVGAFEAAAMAEVFDEAGYCGAHGGAPG